jgi:hypothetical protein
MADRFWVGGNGNWNATDTTNWSTTSGGAGGASAPTSADDVYFDANSNVGTDPFTVTVTGTEASPAVCNDFTASGLDGALTLSMPNTATLDCFGSMTLPATNFSVSGTNTNILRFRATTTGKTLTTNGVSLAAITSIRFLETGTYTLGSALSFGVFITLRQGVLDTSNFNVTGNNIAIAGDQIRNFIIGSSTITLTNIFDVSGTNYSINAGTSQINLSNASPTFTGGGLTFHNVSFTSTASGTAHYHWC